MWNGNFNRILNQWDFIDIIDIMVSINHTIYLSVQYISIKFQNNNDDGKKIDHSNSVDILFKLWLGTVPSVCFYIQNLRNLRNCVIKFVFLICIVIKSFYDLIKLGLIQSNFTFYYFYLCDKKKYFI